MCIISLIKFFAILAVHALGTLQCFRFFKNGPIPASFCLFSIFSYKFKTNWKKQRWCAWDSNPGLQDGRHRRNHGAIANKFGHRFSFNLSSFHIATLYLVSKCYKTSRAFYHLSKYSEEDVYFWDKIIDHSHMSNHLQPPRLLQQFVHWQFTSKELLNKPDHDFVLKFWNITSRRNSSQ